MPHAPPPGRRLTGAMAGADSRAGRVARPVRLALVTAAALSLGACGMAGRGPGRQQAEVVSGSPSTEPVAVDYSQRPYCGLHPGTYAAAGANAFAELLVD